LEERTGRERALGEEGKRGEEEDSDDVEKIRCGLYHFFFFLTFWTSVTVGLRIDRPHPLLVGEGVILEWATGDRYEGHAVLVDAKRGVYEPDGQGQLVTSGGTVLEGAFERGRQVSGTRTEATGAAFRGRFDEDGRKGPAEEVCSMRAMGGPKDCRV
jgi:hypothetical protein